MGRHSISIFIILVTLFAVGIVNSTAQEVKNGYLALCYHDVPEAVDLDNYGVDQSSFIQQLEYLRTHGYNFISFDDVLKANRNEITLPEKAILLTFDDGYLTFYEFVFPLLKLYGYPCMLAIVTNWYENGPPKDIKLQVMNWDHLKEISESGLVEIVTHTDSLHIGVLHNPQGNVSWSATSRIYDRKTKTYENDDLFRARISEDLKYSRKVMKEKLGIDVRAVVWPYGQYNEIGIEEAKANGYLAAFTLGEKVAGVDNLYEIPRPLIEKNPSITDFITEIKRYFQGRLQQRIVQADLDLIYDADTLQQEKNLDKFIERIYNMNVNTVYLQAFHDFEGKGNISSVYFPNRVLPVKADIFSRVVNQLFIRGVMVYAWMSMLSIVLPDSEETEKLRVREIKNGVNRLSTSWYNRLSPFSPEARAKLIMLYEDVAAHARISGIVFQDDGYLNDFEDFHPDAMKEYVKISGSENIPFQNLSDLQKDKWTETKTKALIGLTDDLKKAVRRYRRDAIFVRTLYPPVLLKPHSEEWFAQNYTETLKSYDYAMIMSYPYLEKVVNPDKWLRELVREAAKFPDGIQKTIFKVQTYDWNKKEWVDTKTINKWLRILVSSGALHVGYYPDNFIENQPNDKIIKLMMSTEDFPFIRKKR